MGTDRVDGLQQPASWISRQNEPSTTPSWLSRSSKLTSPQVAQLWTTSSIDLSQGQAIATVANARQITFMFLFLLKGNVNCEVFLCKATEKKLSSRILELSVLALGLYLGR